MPRRWACLWRSNCRVGPSPSLDNHVHYPAITRIVRRAAAEFGVTYNTTTLAGMVASHFRFLKRMGRA